MKISQILQKNKDVPQVFGEYLDHLGGYCASGIVLSELGYEDALLDEFGYNETEVTFDDYYAMKTVNCNCRDDYAVNLDLHDLLMHWNDHHRFSFIEMAGKLRELEKRGLIQEVKS